MLRIGVAGLIGIVSVSNRFCVAIDYQDSRNSGVGTMFMMMVIFGAFFLFLGMIGTTLFIKFRTYAVPVLKWAGIVAGVLLIFWIIINLLARAR